LTIDDAIDASEVEVCVRSGIVELRGTIGDLRQKLLAERVVAAVLGVSEVENRLVVQRLDGTEPIESRDIW